MKTRVISHGHQGNYIKINTFSLKYARIWEFRPVTYMALVNLIYKLRMEKNRIAEKSDPIPKFDFKPKEFLKDTKAIIEANVV